MKPNACIRIKLIEYVFSKIFYHVFVILSDIATSIYERLCSCGDLTMKSFNKNTSKYKYGSVESQGNFCVGNRMFLIPSTRCREMVLYISLKFPNITVSIVWVINRGNAYCYFVSHFLKNSAKNRHIERMDCYRKNHCESSWRFPSNFTYQEFHQYEPLGPYIYVYPNYHIKSKFRFENLYCRFV